MKERDTLEYLNDNVNLKGENMNKNNIWAVVLFVLIGLSMIGYGVYGLYKTSKYDKTTAYFDYSQLVEQRDSDGKSKSYTWFYHYTVNGKTYNADVDSKQIKEPKEKETIVKYDPKDPSKSIVEKDYGYYILIIVGAIFASTAFVLVQPEKGLTAQESARRNVKNGGLYVTFFASVMYLLLFMTVDFNLFAMLTNMLLPCLIVGVFLAVGIFLIKKGYDPNYEFNYEIKDGKKVVVEKKLGEDSNISSSENSNLENRINDVINSDYTKKAMYNVVLIKDIMGIIAGVIVCIISLIPVVFSLIMVLLSKILGGDTFYVNDEEVTVIQFIFSSFSPFQLLILAIGIIIIISRVVVLKKHNNNYHNEFN